jgi:hypothetical protein
MINARFRYGFLQQLEEETPASGLQDPDHHGKRCRGLQVCTYVYIGPRILVRGAGVFILVPAPLFPWGHYCRRSG